MYILLIYLLVLTPIYSINKCSDLSPNSLGIGQFCLSNCDAYCNDYVTPPGFSNLPVVNMQTFKSDCKDDKKRFICTPTELVPHGYPLCQVLNLKFCTNTTCACWTSCMDEQCPEGFVLKRNHVTNSGCFDSNRRKLCVK